MAKGDLTNRQKRFVDEYLIDLNGAQAVIRAGYAQKNARVTAAQLLANPNVSDAVRRAIESRAKRLEVDQDAVLLEIARVAFSDARKLFDGNNLKNITDLDDNTARAVASVKVVTKSLGDGQVEYVHEIKLWPKTSALEMAGKHIGLFERDNLQKRPMVVVRDFTGDGE